MAVDLDDYVETQFELRQTRIENFREKLNNSDEKALDDYIGTVDELVFASIVQLEYFRIYRRCFWRLKKLLDRSQIGELETELFKLADERINAEKKYLKLCGYDESEE